MKGAVWAEERTEAVVALLVLVLTKFSVMFPSKSGRRRYVSWESMLTIVSLEDPVAELLPMKTASVNKIDCIIKRAVDIGAQEKNKMMQTYIQFS